MTSELQISSIFNDLCQQRYSSKKKPLKGFTQRLQNDIHAYYLKENKSVLESS